MNTKYEFVEGDTKELAGRTLRRIRALVAIGDFASPGELGGYIESEKNLAVYCNAWVYGDALVYGNAWVSGDACVSGNALVYGDAWVYGNALVSGNAWVSGEACVSGNALVYGNAWVYGNALVSGNALVYGKDSYLLIGPAKSSGRFTTAHMDDKLGVRVNCGCFSGTVKEFSDAIEKTHANNRPALEQYRLFCQLIAFNFGVTGEQA